MRQVEAFLGTQGAVVAVDDLGAQQVATLLQGQRGGILGAGGHFDTRTALAAQFQGLAELDAGGAAVAAGVFGVPGGHRVGDQAGLLATAFGDVDFPLCDRQVRVVGEGGLQGCIEGEGLCLGGVCGYPQCQCRRPQQCSNKIAITRVPRP